MALSEALRQSGGDLARATALAEQAVALDPRNAGYRNALAEIHLRSSRPERPERARKECAAAAHLAARWRRS